MTYNFLLSGGGGPCEVRYRKMPKMQFTYCHTATCVRTTEKIAIASTATVYLAIEHAFSYTQYIARKLAERSNHLEGAILRVLSGAWARCYK